MWGEGTISIQFRNESDALVFYKKLEQTAPKVEDFLGLKRKDAEE
jgi:hypothetical protein